MFLYIILLNDLQNIIKDMERIVSENIDVKWAENMTLAINESNIITMKQTLVQYDCSELFVLYAIELFRFSLLTS